MIVDSAIVVPGATVVAIEQSRLATSHALYDLTAEVEGGRVELILKDLSPSAVIPEARGRRPALVDEPIREIAAYARLLADADLGTARCWAAHSDPDRDEHWLVLEKVTGVELYQVGEPETWGEVARWLARFHRAMARHVPDPPASLLRHDARFYRAWAERAAAANDDRRLAWVLDRYERTVVDALVELPRTMIHGDCSASNVLVDRSAGHVRRVCPVDWESTAVGPGAADVAALVSGWAAAERRSIALAYHEAAGGDAATADAFLADVDRCAVQLCVQWLGWSPGWVPPVEHRQDWLATAVTLLERLGE